MKVLVTGVAGFIGIHPRIASRMGDMVAVDSFDRITTSRSRARGQLGRSAHCRRGFGRWRPPPFHSAQVT
jgi:nucleoside-diphosphate-sugar epimerase